MFGIETNQKQINKLDKQVTTIRKTLEGGLWDGGLEERVNTHKEYIKTLESNVSNMRERLSVLEEIVRESGLITDFDSDEVKIRQDRMRDIYGGINVKQVPYQINKVKVV
jgi:predicted phage tail protein